MIYTLKSFKKIYENLNILYCKIIKKLKYNLNKSMNSKKLIAPNNYNNNFQNKNEKKCSKQIKIIKKKN